MTNVCVMKFIDYSYPANLHMHIASEPEVLYVTESKLNKFQIKSFEKLNQKLLFSQAEWADILHISDRTLQRYIKDDKPFEGLHAEHLYQLENMANLALEVFSTPEAVRSWLFLPKTILNKNLGFSALKSFWGAKLISNELGRIAYGVYI